MSAVVSKGFLAVAVVVVLVLSGPNISMTAMGRVIGQFERLWSEADLTEDDVRNEGGGLRILAPPLASAVKVDRAYLDQRLGAWSTSEPFALDEEGRIVIAGDNALISPLELGEQAVFTFGSAQSVLMVDRPMWVSVVNQDSDGLRLNFDDGDTAGQTIFLAEAWLSRHGIRWPRITHENGTELEAVYGEGGRGWTFEMPHFSFVVITSSELPVRGRQAGIVFPHVGEVRWDANATILEIDVGAQLSAYDVLVPKSWVDKHVPNPHASGWAWQAENVGGAQYYVVALGAAQTPATLRIHEIPWVTHSFSLNITDFLNKVGSGEPVTLPLGPNDSVDIYLEDDVANEDAPSLTSVQGGSAFNVTVRLIHENSTLTPNNVTARFTYTVTNLSDGGSADALYGYIRKITPMGVQNLCELVAGVAPGPAVQVCRTVLGDEPTGGNPDPYPYNPPAPPRQREIDSQFYLDLAFWGSFPSFDDAANHVIHSVWNGEHNVMWSRYTGNVMGGGVIGAIHTFNLDPGTDCTDHLDAFTLYLNDNNRRSDVTNRHYTLVTGQMQDCNGIALSVPGNGALAIPTDSLVLGADRPGGSYNGRTSPIHLGKVLAQELGHNWGQFDHVCQEVSGEWSVMADGGDCGIPVNWRKFWLHYGDSNPAGAPNSAGNIISGTSGYD